MKPIFKYSGGKSRELKRIRALLPNGIDRVIEPFAGGAAVFFDLEKPGQLNDIRTNNMAVYRAVKSKNLYPALQDFVDEWKTYDIETLNTKYYEQRDGQWGVTSDLSLAKRWIVIRQLTFSGIDRVNPNTGKFNSPFGWYKKFNCNLSEDHHKLLQDVDIREGSFERTLGSRNTDFIFLDPPYLNRNSTYGGTGDDQDLKLHKGIAKYFKEKSDLGAKLMLVHTDCEEYRKMYKDYNIVTKDFMYSQNFKGRDNSNQKVQHIYITNYDW